MDIKDIECHDVVWIHLALDRIRCTVLVKKQLDFGFFNR